MRQLKVNFWMFSLASFIVSANAHAAFQFVAPTASDDQQFIWADVGQYKLTIGTNVINLSSTAASVSLNWYATEELISGGCKNMTTLFDPTTAIPVTTASGSIPPFTPLLVSVFKLLGQWTDLSNTPVESGAYCIWANIVGTTEYQALNPVASGSTQSLQYYAPADVAANNAPVTFNYDFDYDNAYDTQALTTATAQIFNNSTVDLSMTPLSIDWFLSPLQADACEDLTVDDLQTEDVYFVLSNHSFYGSTTRAVTTVTSTSGIPLANVKNQGGQKLGSGTYCLWAHVSVLSSAAVENNSNYLVYKQPFVYAVTEVPHVLALSNSIVLDPNPAKLKMKVSYNLNVDSSDLPISLMVSDILGQTLPNFSQKLDLPASVITLDVSDLASGVYFLKVASGHDSIVRRFIKE